MNKLERMLWDEIEPVTEGGYAVWNCPPKVQWAKQAWEFVIQAGLADYTNDLEHAQVVIRLLALAGIYADFYELAFEDGFKPDHGEWAGKLGLTPFRVGQLIGQDNDWIEEPDDGGQYVSALQQLTDNARPEVRKALLRGFASESELFISLWQSRQRSFLLLIEDETEVPDSDIVNNITPEKMIVFEWLRDGCYPL